MHRENKLSYFDCSYEIINTIFEVHRRLGPGLPERGYQNESVCFRRLTRFK